MLLPLVVYSLPFFVTQAWYESGGLVSAVVSLAVFDALGYTFRWLQLPPLFQRYVLAPLTATSQTRLDALWQPSPMFIGELHANALKTAAIALVYAPLYPIVYLISAAGCLYAYASCKVALCVWWRRPPHLNDELLQRLRASLVLLLIVHLSLSLAASAYVESSLRGSSTYWYSTVGRTALCALACAAYAVAPISRVPCLARYTGEQGVQGGARDPELTQRFDQVAAARGHAVDAYAYECPTLGGPGAGRDKAMRLEQQRTRTGWQPAAGEESSGPGDDGQYAAP